MLNHPIAHHLISQVLKQASINLAVLLYTRGRQSKESGFGRSTYPLCLRERLYVPDLSSVVDLPAGKQAKSLEQPSAS